MVSVGEMFLRFLCGFLERPARNWKRLPLRQQKPHSPTQGGGCGSQAPLHLGSCADPSGVVSSGGQHHTQLDRAQVSFLVTSF